MNVSGSSPEKDRTINVIPVVDTMPADLLTPLAVYLKLSAGGGSAFLFESVSGGENLARYSFIGARPEMTVSGDEGQVTIDDPKGTRTVETPLFDYLREHFSTRHAGNDPDLPSFIGGAIGYLGFSCVDWFEPKLKREGPGSVHSDACFMMFRSVVAFDHAKQVIKIISLVFPKNEGEANSERDLMDRAAAVNAEIRRVLEDPHTPVPRVSDDRHASDINSNWERGDFESAVDKIKELIRAGECYQVVLSQRFSKLTSASEVAIYRALRSLNPSPYMFLLRFPDVSVIGASPEMLVRCQGGEIEYRPIAGTRPRGRSTAQDIALANEMRADGKEVSEHVMLVDLGRNDLGRVAEYGSVQVAELMKVEKYSHVQHLVSSLKARLRSGLDRFDVLAACFPAGTVSGAPKVRAVEIIRELEPDDRGVYAGAVGYFGYSENMDTCIAIRTIVLRDGVAHIQAGAGIVAESVPALEFDETVNKARALIKSVEIAEGGQL